MLSALSGALYFPTTANVCMTMCADAAEAPLAPASWLLFSVANLVGALIGALSCVYALGRSSPLWPARLLASTRTSDGPPIVREESLGSVLLPALSECVAMTLVWLGYVLVDELPYTSLDGSYVMGRGLMTLAISALCWGPFAFVRSLYFALVTASLVFVTKKPGALSFLLVVPMLGFGVWLSIRSLQLTSPHDSVLVPSALILAVGGHAPEPRR